MVKVNMFHLDGYEDWHITKTTEITIPSFTKNDILDYLIKKDILNVDQENEDKPEGVDEELVKQLLTEIKEITRFKGVLAIQWMGEEFGYIFVPS